MSATQAWRAAARAADLATVRAYLDETDGADLDVEDYVGEVGGDTINEGEIDGAIYRLYNNTY